MVINQGRKWDAETICHASVGVGFGFGSMMMSKGDRDENAVAKPAGRIWAKKQVHPLDASTGYYPKKRDCPTEIVISMFGFKRQS